MRTRHLATALAALVLLAGCGDQPSSATNDAAATATSTDTGPADPAAGTDTDAAEPATTAPAASGVDAPGPPDPCLLTKTEMSRMAGVEIVATDTDESSKEVAVCAYHFHSADGPAILLQYHRGGAAMINNPLFKGTEKVSGLGTPAEWFDGQAGLHVAVGDGDALEVMLGVSSVKLRGGDLKGLAVDIAKLALTRLAG
ncbi:hypothetical protein [Micromonospora sp. CB01531]|uniref:hypothetical protein n=1 Tax=Micromonospora sp. CB01531 TaxID=1718947 RepID=UPI00093B30CC|nr:hypothetical protein [Micromonospora sp. CB01531]OKI52810.1 hypothetical protein A6A27_07895 [Micromonospora sp. CB01531]